MRANFFVSICFWCCGLDMPKGLKHHLLPNKGHMTSWRRSSRRARRCQYLNVSFYHSVWGFCELVFPTQVDTGHFLISAGNWQGHCCTLLRSGSQNGWPRRRSSGANLNSLCQVFKLKCIYKWYWFKPRILDVLSDISCPGHLPKSPRQRLTRSILRLELKILTEAFSREDLLWKK